MDCDGLKKSLLTDTDGSFFGQPSTVFSEAEYLWGNVHSVICFLPLCLIFLQAIKLMVSAISVSRK
jgi:hypothetical protein